MALLGSLLLLSSCTERTGGSTVAARTELTVSAAASLSTAFGELATAFESRHPGIELALNLGGSSTLREQILAGAPVDLFAAASPEEVASVARAGMVAGDVVLFARNQMVLAVPAGNPAAVDNLADLAREELLVGLCAAAVPCGVYARRILASSGVEPAADTDEPNARALLGKIESGDLDAGLVYATDAASSARVEALGLPVETEIDIDYPIAVLARSQAPDAARAFVAFLLSAEGRALLESHGFGTP